MLGSWCERANQAFLLHKPVIRRFPRLVWTHELDVESPVHLRQDLVHLNEGDVFANAAPSARSKVEAKNMLSSLQLFFRSVDST